MSVFPELLKFYNIPFFLSTPLISKKVFLVIYINVRIYKVLSYKLSFQTYSILLCEPFASSFPKPIISYQLKSEKKCILYKNKNNVGSCDIFNL